MDEYIIHEKGKQFLLTLIACALAFMVSFDYGSLNISLAAIAKYFNIKIGNIAWLPTIYLLIITSATLGFGKLGDMIGYKRVLIIGLVIFAAGGILCAISANFHLLLAARTIQAIGEAMFGPISIAILTVFLPQGIRGRALGLYATSQGIGMAVGPAIGGIISNSLSWRGNFSVAVLISIILMFASLKIIPSRQTKASDMRFDYIGAALLFLFMGSFLYALNSGTKAGWGDPVIISCLIASLIGAAAFITWEKKIAYPILDLNLFKNLNFTYGASSAFLVLLLAMGFSFIFPFYLQLVKGLPVDKAGLITTVPSLAMMVLAPISGSLSDRIGSRKLCIFGMIMVAASFVGFFSLSQFSHILHVMPSLALFGAGLGLFLAPNNKLVLSHAPGDKQGVASGVYKICLNAGSSIGIALFVLIISQVVVFDIAKTHMFLSEAKSHPEIVMAGFRAAFIIGFIIAVLNVVFTILTRDKETQ